MTVFRQETPSFMALLIALIVPCALGGIMIKAALWDTERDTASYLIVVIMSLGIGVTVYYFILLVRTPDKISLENDCLIISTYSDAEFEIPYKNIIGVKELAVERGKVAISYDFSGRSRSFIAHCERVKFSNERAIGKLIEMILARSSNIGIVDIDRLANAKNGNWSAWAKEPDWTIIGEAKSRAEKNRQHES